MRVNRDLQVHKILAERSRAKVSRNPFMTPLQTKTLTANNPLSGDPLIFDINNFNSVTGTNVGVKTVYIDMFDASLLGPRIKRFGLVYLNPHIMVKPGSDPTETDPSIGTNNRLAVNLNIQVEDANGRLYSVRYNAGDQINAGTVLTTNPGPTPNVNQEEQSLQLVTVPPALNDNVLYVFIQNGQVQLGLTTNALAGTPEQRARVSIEVLEA